MRVHELAKELNKTSAEIIAIASAMGIAVKAAQSNLSDSDAERIRKEIGGSSNGTAPKQEEKKAEKAGKPAAPSTKGIGQDSEPGL